MYTYDTVSEAINGLKDRGYNLDFNLANDHLYCSEPGIILKAQDFIVLKEIVILQMKLSYMALNPGREKKVC